MSEHEGNTELSLAELWSNASKLVAKGWSPVPIEPTSKACKVPGWTRFCSEPPTAEELKSWGADPRGFGIGLAMGRHLDDGSHIMCLDWDVAPENEALAAAVEAKLGIDRCPAKRGARGWSTFVRVRGCDGHTKNATKVGASEMLGVDGKSHSQAVQVLGLGAQSVIPPTLHPDLGRPYAWLPGRCLWPMVEGRPTVVPAEALPAIEWGDLVEALAGAGFGTSNMRPRSDAAEPPVVDFEELSDEAVVELLDRLEFDGGDLGDLWNNGSDAKLFSRRGKTATGNERRHELGFQMRKAGYAFGDYIAALREWNFTVGNKPFDVDEDLSRSNSRLVASWGGAGLRLAPADGSTGAFEAAFDDEPEGEAAGGGPGAGKPARRPFARGRSLDEIAAAGRRSAPLTLVEGLIGHGHIVECFGAYGSGKTAFVAAVALALATGGDLGGRKTDRRAVVIGAYEDADGVASAVVTGAARAGLDLSSVPIHIVSSNDGAPLPNLATDADRPVEAFRSYAAAAEARFGIPVGLIVVDTRGRATTGMKEHDPDAASLYNARIAAISGGTGAAIWANSHPAKSGNGETSAGSGKFGNDADDVFSIENKDGVRTVTARKSKGGRFGATARFDLEVVASSMLVRGPGGEVLPPEEWGTVALLHWLSGWGFPAEGGAAERGKVKPLDPGTLAGEAYAVLETGGGCVLSDLANRVTEARLARGLDADVSPIAVRRLRRSLDSALRKPAAAKWVTQVEGRWFTLDAARMLCDDGEEAA